MRLTITEANIVSRLRALETIEWECKGPFGIFQPLLPCAAKPLMTMKQWINNAQGIRHLSGAIAAKRILVTVDLAVKRYPNFGFS